MSIKGEQDVHLDLEMENEILRLRVKELEKQMGSPGRSSVAHKHHNDSEFMLPDVEDVESGKLMKRPGVILSDSSKIVVLNSTGRKSKPLPTGTLLKAATMTGNLKPEHNREFFMGLVEAPRRGRQRSAPAPEEQGGEKDWIDPHAHRLRFAKHNRGPLSFQKAYEDLREKGLTAGVKTPRSRLELPNKTNRLPPETKKGLLEGNPTAEKRKQRKAIAALKGALAARFESVYEAFTFLDNSGDWQISITDALVGLRKLKIEKEASLELQIEALDAIDRLNERRVCPRTFVKLLAWHPEFEDWHAGLEEARTRRRQILGRAERDGIVQESRPLSVFNSTKRSAGASREAGRSGVGTPVEGVMREAAGLGGTRKGGWRSVTISEEGNRRGEEGERGSSESSGEESDSEGEREARERKAEEEEEEEEGMVHMEAGGKGGAGAAKERERGEEGKDLIQMDLPTLGGRVLDLQDQEMLAAIEQARADKKKMQDEAGGGGMSTTVTVRGRRLDDNVTLPMNTFSLSKTKWLLTIYDYLCVRLDAMGKRTSKIGEGKVCEGVMVPETLVYRQHTISQWYYVDASNKIARKNHTKEFTAPNIQNSFCKSDRVHQGDAKATDALGVNDPVAYFVELSEHAQGDGSDYAIKWLDQKGLDAFLRSHEKPRSGLLQRFVAPVGRHNQLIRVSWTPHHQVVETGSNVNGWQDVSVDLPKRLATFEASHDLCERGSLSHFRAKDVLSVVDKITGHVNALLPSGTNCWSGVFYLKLNPNSELLFLWCSDLQVRNYYDVDPGFVPRPYNHADERPTRPYASEKKQESVSPILTSERRRDRRQRIEKVKSNPRDITAWKALTKFDRKVLRIMHDELVALEERGGFPSGDPSTRLGEDDDEEEANQEEEEEEEEQRKLTIQIEEKSELPKTKRRHLDKYFMSLGPEREIHGHFLQSLHHLNAPQHHRKHHAPGSLESTAELPAAAEGSTVRQTRQSRNNVGPSLSEIFQRTTHWAPHKQPMHPPRTSTPRLRAPVNGRAEAWEGNVETFLCPMPSAVCAQRHQLQPARTSLVTYKQCLAILGADKADVLAYILSAGDGKRLGPEKYCAPNPNELEDPDDPREGARSRESMNDSRDSLNMSQTAGKTSKSGKKTTMLNWQESRDDLIMRTLLQAQQGTLRGVSIREMVDDNIFLRREVEVCERCALLINKWAQFDQDPEERTKAKVAAILKHQS